MNNTIELKSISELLGLNFFIPSYQRGYRWSEPHIRDLLQDIYSFAIRAKISEREFYCLQPIIVKKREGINFNENREEYEIIDGQQRLTTIRVLFSYLIKNHLNGEPLEQEYDKPLYTIRYETRPESTDFLDHFQETTDDNILIINNENIDFYYIRKAYEYIDKWFKEQNKQRNAREAILQTLINNNNDKTQYGIVKVIWYEIKENKTNPIDTFIRINLGKISLTNAELIKALFLQERNFGEGDAAKLKQLKIAQKWDLIENEMQKDNFWWFLNKTKNKVSSHIEFIFNMICNEDICVDQDIIGKDKDRTFRYYVYRFGTDPDNIRIKKLWDEIENRYETLKEWYSNPVWYHYIGFLVFCGKSISQINTLLNIKSIKTKEEVTNELIKEIKKEFQNLIWIKEDNELHLNLTYVPENSSMLRKFFLLFNLEYINKQCNNKNLIYYFPFKSFKIEKDGNKKLWDIEHINSATENSLEKFDDQKEWLINAKLDIDNIPNDLIKSINSFIKKEEDNQGKFDLIQNKIIELANENKISDTLKNSIGNLTLLDAGTNRGYGNALFSTKRRIIIQKDKEGTFVPPCTKNVFLKYFDGNVKSKWVNDDIIGYQKVLEEIMQKFIPKGDLK